MFGLRWLKNTNSAIANSQPPLPPEAEAPVELTPQQRILDLCKKPQTLGDLSDSVGLSLKEASKMTTSLIAQGKLKTVLLPLENSELNVIHFVVFDTLNL